MKILSLLAAHAGWREILLIAGLGLAGYGAGLIYFPLGFLLPGVALVAIAALGVA